MGWFERGRKEIPGGYSESQEFAGFPLLYARYASTRRKDEIAVRNSVSSTEIHSTTLNIHFQTVFEDKRWYRKFWLVLGNKNIYKKKKKIFNLFQAHRTRNFIENFKELIAFSFEIFTRWIFKKLRNKKLTFPSDTLRKFQIIYTPTYYN